MSSGLFITFEGVEGSGKTTQMEMIKEHLEWKGYSVLATREPGGTEIGERIRGILLNKEGETLTPWAELLLYVASRAQLVADVINPALEGGRIVLCDRFSDSTIVYQGYVKGLPLEAIKAVNRLAVGEMKPDITFVIDCPVDVGLRRAWGRIDMVKGGNKEDRFERKDMDFHNRVRVGYLRLAQEEPDRIRVIKGDRDVPIIHEEICGIIEKKLEVKRTGHG
ncbi:MAG: dTMP kinase [Deltaproteobacteria bacterium]|nr:dTMP kinase [Deltaproteobacteria bacterium]